MTNVSVLVDFIPSKDVTLACDVSLNRKIFIRYKKVLQLNFRSKKKFFSKFFDFFDLLENTLSINF